MEKNIQIESKRNENGGWGKDRWLSLFLNKSKNHEFLQKKEGKIKGTIYMSAYKWESKWERLSGTGWRSECFHF